VPSKTHPMHYAEKAKRTYITPEDISAAVKAGGKGEEIFPVVLAAISLRMCEDATACAFVAVSGCLGSDWQMKDVLQPRAVRKKKPTKSKKRVSR